MHLFNSDWDCRFVCLLTIYVFIGICCYWFLTSKRHFMLEQYAFLSYGCQFFSSCYLFFSLVYYIIYTGDLRFYVNKFINISSSAFGICNLLRKSFHTVVRLKSLVYKSSFLWCSHKLITIFILNITNTSFSFTFTIYVSCVLPVQNNFFLIIRVIHVKSLEISEKKN